MFPAVYYPSPNNKDRIVIHDLNQLESRLEYGLDDLLSKSTTDTETFFELPSQDGLRLRINVYHRELISPNIVVIRFDESKLYGSALKIIPLQWRMLMDELIPVFQPTEILVYDSTIYYTPDVPDKKYRIIQLPNQRKFDAQIGWMTFWAEPVVNFLGRERFERLSSCAEKIEMHGGFLLVLQHEPFRRDNAEHREREAQVLRELGLLE
ncbi:MAG: hypothetical protein OHK0023_03340 [Anaerolineae bacterium]